MQHPKHQIHKALACFSIFEVLLFGCAKGKIGPPLIPVSGIVMMNGKPLTTGGSVSYRDSTGLIQPGARIAEDGTYKLALDEREGAPPGKYRVVVFASVPAPKANGHGGLPRLIVDQKYMSTETTPLAVEVKRDSPSGAYDLAVTGRN
jgi:hypothetical protein